MQATVDPDSLTSSKNHASSNPPACGIELADRSQCSVSDDRSAEADNWECSPNNPRNWPSLRKWTTTALVSLYTFIPALASSMMAPGLPDLALKYNITNPTILALTLSIFPLSFAIGPLFWSPLSEMYGRTRVLHTSNLLFLCFNIACGMAPNVELFTAFRFLGGFAGSAPISIGGGSVSDIFAEKDRASAMALYSLGPLIGPPVGPVMGGLISQQLGIQFIFYVMACLSGAASILAIPLLRETCAPVIRRRLRTHGLELEKGILVSQGEGRLNRLWFNLKRPMILLTQSSICFVLNLYTALLAGIYYLMFSTFPDLFTRVYHFSAGASGFAYVGLGLGYLGAAVFGAKISDRIYNGLAARNGGQGKPEMRIPALMFGSLSAPIGLLWYGWSAQAEIHWIMPIIGTAVYGFSIMSSILPIQLYLVDAFMYPASALAAASVFRYLLAFAFPLFGEQMYLKLNYGSGNSLLAGLAILIGIPFPIWIYYRGERMRARSPLNN